MRLLVAGAAELDAGKTTFSTGLVAATGATGFKPRAGNDYWFDHDDYRKAVKDGRLYGKDARRLAAASPGEPPPEEINPVHRLWVPTPGAGQGLLGREGRAFVVDRVTIPGGEEYVVNGTVEVPKLARERLPLARARQVESLSAFNNVMAGLHRPALERLREHVATADQAVIESYTDIARPLSGLEPDAVAVVEPRRARIYPGGRYAKACEVAGGSAREGLLEVPVDRVVDLLDPAETLGLPALSDDERADPDVIAAAYVDAYEALLSTAAE